MQYTLLIYETPAEFARRDEVDDNSAHFGAWRAYYKALVVPLVLSDDDSVRAFLLERRNV